MQRRPSRLLAGALVALGLVLAACAGDDDDGAAPATASTTAPTTATTAATTTTEPPTAADVAAAVDQESIEATLTELVGERFTVEQRTEARATITSLLGEAGYDVSEQRFGEDGVNLVATLEGSDPDRPVVVLGAHYDSVEGTPGADDNASGVAGVIEVARALAGTAPEATIQLVLFDLEEAGLVGSSAFVAEAERVGQAIGGAIVLEMIGFTCDTAGCQTPFPDIPDCLDVEPESVDVGTGIGVVGNDDSVELLDRTVAAAETAAPNLESIVARFSGNGECLPDSRRSDHAPFWDAGIPALFLTDTANFRNPNYHQPTDALDTLDLGLVTDVTRATAAAVATAAGVPAG